MNVQYLSVENFIPGYDYTHQEMRRFMINLVNIDDSNTLNILLSDENTRKILTKNQENDLFMIACRDDSIKCMELMFNSGFNQSSLRGYNPSMKICVNYDSIKCLNFLISKGYNVNGILEDGDPLIFAADPISFRILINEGALDHLSDYDLIRLAPTCIYQTGDLISFKEIAKRVDLCESVDSLIDLAMGLDDLGIFEFLISEFNVIDDCHILTAISEDRLLCLKMLINYSKILNISMNKLLDYARASVAHHCISYLEELALMQYEKSELEEALTSSDEGSGKKKSGGRL